MAPDDSPTTEAIEPVGFHTLVRRFRLTVLEGPDAGATFVSQGGRTVIGTHASASFVLHDAAMSGLHCEVLVEEGIALLRDLGSTNGTRVDNVRVLAAQLDGGAVISLGRTRLRFELGQENIKIALSERERFGLLVGRSAAMRALFAVLERAATSDVSVLLLGETGTGKGLAAESLHKASARKDGPLVVVDCASIPPGLVESELFGHEKGAFTGAIKSHAGAFEAADGGTLFLDEVGELPAELQPKLLRAVEGRQVQRIGGDKPRSVDIRLIAATNRNLAAEVNAGRFRPDLYFRLAVLEVSMPSLRDRLDDLPLLVDEIFEQLGARPEQVARLRGAQLLATLRAHGWPGNLRELRNYLELCLAFDEPAPMRSHTDHAPPPIDVTQPIGVARERWLRYMERRYLEEMLRRHGDNVSAAARAAGVNRMHFYRLMIRNGLR
jgi:DNA-binding NtrC family response regulator